jgi:thiol-disulfide isomerase/thioredoxin
MKRLILLATLAWLAAPVAFAAEAELGMPVPDVKLPLLAGGTSMDLAQLRGKVVYLDFWASWCGPCRQSLPELERLRTKYAQHFEVYAVNLDEKPADGLKFLEKYPVSYPVVSDAAARFPEMFGIKGMPTSYLIDREGNLRYMHEGYRDGDAQKIESLIQQLIAE